MASPAPATKKSLKIPSPPMLVDGKEPRFKDWLLLMNQKLAANADHYNAPQLQMVYVASRCEGKAWKLITLRNVRRISERTPIWIPLKY